MSKWISTKKYLPPFHDDVLLYVPDVEDIPEILIGYMESDGNFYFDLTKEKMDHDRIEHVSYWMPLPEKPNDT